MQGGLPNNTNYQQPVNVNRSGWLTFRDIRQLIILTHHPFINFQFLITIELPTSQLQNMPLLLLYKRQQTSILIHIYIKTGSYFYLALIYMIVHTHTNPSIRILIKQPRRNIPKAHTRPSPSAKTFNQSPKPNSNHALFNKYYISINT